MKLSASLSALACAGVLLASGVTTGTVIGQSAQAQTAAADTPAAAFERDRQSILAMTGDYKVTFDFIETVPFLKDYELKERKLSGGNEIVRVIEDTGDFISLQHILVVGPEDAPIVVKHWRQDWQYEPQRVLVFIGGNAWEWRDVPASERAGAWSQTVYQVDDAPRYGAVGDWIYEDGIAEWTPPAEWRPLPRRDMTTRDDYHAVDAVNRHTITPNGWVHEQDNSKLILTEEPQALVREIGVNTYRRNSDFDVAVGDSYWAATEDYWAGVRDEWAEIEAEYPRFAITIKGETEALYNPLLGLANEVQAGERDTASAVTEARSVIRSFVTPDISALADRLRPADQSAVGEEG
ncbi:hypothetical protein D1224_02580 [Henriciella barbarensis]|uniref:Uncharacterized protein n=1 Tax=Henriciella barbarensis TaxID=86342 RepID=A0A399R444_9PROT|nr:DUF6607 family protein [Henriciella barbarensis]RIJ26020.1 hypothetical protein D1224_02580 [Henriciella barbarensis]